MSLRFDYHGNLFPYSVIEITWEEFKLSFVDNFSKDLRRQKLFKYFQEFINRFRVKFQGEFFVWINGSFVSKKLNPWDIDAVFFLDFRTCEGKELILQTDFFNHENLERFGLDFYYVKIFPQNHKKHYLFLLDQLNWKEIYGKTRRNEAGFQFSKGFIEIKFKNDGFIKSDQSKDDSDF